MFVVSGGLNKTLPEMCRPEPDKDESKQVKEWNKIRRVRLEHGGQPEPVNSRAKGQRRQPPKGEAYPDGAARLLTGTGNRCFVFFAHLLFPFQGGNDCLANEKQ